MILKVSVTRFIFLYRSSGRSPPLGSVSFPARRCCQRDWLVVRGLERHDTRLARGQHARARTSADPCHLLIDCDKGAALELRGERTRQGLLEKLAGSTKMGGNVHVGNTLSPAREDMGRDLLHERRKNLLKILASDLHAGWKLLRPFFRERSAFVYRKLIFTERPKSSGAGREQRLLSANRRAWLGDRGCQLGARDGGRSGRK